MRLEVSRGLRFGFISSSIHPRSVRRFVAPALRLSAGRPGFRPISRCVANVTDEALTTHWENTAHGMVRAEGR